MTLWEKSSEMSKLVVSNTEPFDSSSCRRPLSTSRSLSTPPPAPLLSTKTGSGGAGWAPEHRPKCTLPNNVVRGQTSEIKVGLLGLVELLVAAGLPRLLLRRPQPGPPRISPASSRNTRTLPSRPSGSSPRSSFTMPPTTSAASSNSSPPSLPPPPPPQSPLRSSLPSSPSSTTPPSPAAILSHSSRLPSDASGPAAAVATSTPTREACCQGSRSWSRCGAFATANRRASARSRCFSRLSGMRPGRSSGRKAAASVFSPEWWWPRRSCSCSASTCRVREGYHVPTGRRS